MVLYAFLLLLLLPPQLEVGPRRHIGRQDESRYRNSVLCVWSQARSALQKREPFKQEAGNHPVTPPHLASAPAGLTRGRHNGRDSLVGRVHTLGQGKAQLAIRGSPHPCRGTHRAQEGGYTEPFT